MSENANPYEIVIQNATISFPKVFEAESIKGGKPRFSASFLLDKETDAKQIEKIEKTIAKLIKEKLKGKNGKALTKLPADKVCLRDGDEKEYDGYEGKMFINAANLNRPTVVDRKQNPVTEADDLIYGGAIVTAIIRLWAQDSKEYGKRINASLEVVQFIKEGQRFGAPKADLGALPELPDDEDDSDEDEDDMMD